MTGARPISSCPISSRPIGPPVHPHQNLQSHDTPTSLKEYQNKCQGYDNPSLPKEYQNKCNNYDNPPVHKDYPNKCYENLPVQNVYPNKSQSYDTPATLKDFPNKSQSLHARNIHGFERRAEEMSTGDVNEMCPQRLPMLNNSDVRCATGKPISNMNNMNMNCNNMNMNCNNVNMNSNSMNNRISPHENAITNNAGPLRYSPLSQSRNSLPHSPLSQSRNSLPQTPQSMKTSPSYSSNNTSPESLDSSPTQQHELQNPKLFLKTDVRPCNEKEIKFYSRVSAFTAFGGNISLPIIAKADHSQSLPEASEVNSPKTELKTNYSPANIIVPIARRLVVPGAPPPTETKFSQGNSDKSELNIPKQLPKFNPGNRVPLVPSIAIDMDNSNKFDLNKENRKRSIVDEDGPNKCQKLELPPPQYAQYQNFNFPKEENDNMWRPW